MRASSRIARLAARVRPLTLPAVAPPGPPTDADWADLFDRWAADGGLATEPHFPAAAASFRAAVTAGDGAAVRDRRARILDLIARDVAAAVVGFPG